MVEGAGMIAKKIYGKIQLLRIIIISLLLIVPAASCYSDDDLSPKFNKHPSLKKTPILPVVDLPLPVIEGFQLGAYRTYDSENKLYRIKCVQENIIIKIYEDPTNHAIDIVINGLRESLLEDSINEFTIKLCGNSNSVAYQLKGPAKKMVSNRRLTLDGSAGFDYVDLKLSLNTHGRKISLNNKLSFNLNFKGGNDNLEASFNHIEKNSILVMDVNDINRASILWRNEAKVAGSARINIEGDASDDKFFISMMDVDIENRGSINLNIYGDNKQLIPNNSETVHGNDEILFSYRGKVVGYLSAMLHGDDGAFRIASPLCVSTPCDLFGATIGGSDLEQQLRNNRDYAFDNVQAAFILKSESLGDSNITVDAGLGDDTAVLLYKGVQDSIARHEYSLSGGSHYRGQSDTCYPEIIEGSPSACRFFSHDIVNTEFDFFFDD